MSGKSNQSKRWQVVKKRKSTKTKLKSDQIIQILLTNRGIKTKKERLEFLKPTHPGKIKIKDFGIKKEEILKSVKRILQARKEKEKIIIYGDYDADGICGTAILWETLYYFNFDVSPYIPERVSEGYGLNLESIKKLKKQNKDFKLLITVDNGIVAHKEIKEAKKLGIDTIICDHHIKGKKIPRALAIIHTTKVCATTVAWILSREIKKKIKKEKPRVNLGEGLDLCAIGTVADQMSLVGINRSFAKYGIGELNDTKRPGLKALFEEAGLNFGVVGSYAIGFVIAPRLNAMGRLEHAIDSLRLLCTTSTIHARELARALGKTNVRRQKVVEDTLLHAKGLVKDKSDKGIIIISHESYNEGVIGLAAAKLVEEYFRPAIVLSKGKEISKASARSIPGFNIIEFIQKYDYYLESGGGHSMAAGFSIKTQKLAEFSRLLKNDSKELLTSDLTTRTLKIDTEVDFDQIDSNLVEKMEVFEPTGLGNPSPSFVTKKVDVLWVRIVGNDGKHLKMSLQNNSKTFQAVAFGMAEDHQQIIPGKAIDIVYGVGFNTWNGNKNIELKIKDIREDKS